MADLPISQLPEITAATTVSEFVVVESGVTYKIKTPNIAKGNLHGAFHSEVSQFITSANTPFSMSASSVDFAVGVTVVDGCKFTVASTGTYNFQFSAVFKKVQGGNIEFVSVWLEQNGNPVPWSNTDMSMANNNELIVAAWNFVIEMNANDFVELKWSSTTTAMQMVGLSPQSNPSRPGTPSLIVTLTQI